MDEATSGAPPLQTAEVRRARRPQSWREALPWDGPPARGDKVLLWLIVAVIVVALASFPLRPFLLASHPVVLEFATGSFSAVGSAAAFARLGEMPLWLVLVGGVVGMIKFDWLFWLAGRRWGARVVAMFAPGERALRFVDKVRAWPPWVLRVVVAASAIPGVPAGAVFALAGLSRMRAVTFMLYNALGALVITGLVAGLGYGLGQYAVDVVLVVDTYATWISVGMITIVSVMATRKAKKEVAADREAMAQEQQAA